MKLILLDRLTLTAGDIDFSPITDQVDCEIYDILSEDEIASVCKDADMILCNKANINKRVIDSAKKLKFIGLFATGYNNIDIKYARQKGIDVVNVPGYSTDSVTQLTFTLLLMLATNAHLYNTSVANGEWIRSHTFSYFPYPIQEIYGKILGIVGCGQIGQNVGKIGAAFGMKVIYYTRAKKEGFDLVSKDELFSNSDFLSLHCPLNEDSSELICKKTLNQMKKSAFLINTSRGGVINEKDLFDALVSGTIAGAALDVLTFEPMRSDNLLLNAPNCIITPHIAWASYEARVRLIKCVAENVSAFLSGKPINVVN